MYQLYHNGIKSEKSLILWKFSFYWFFLDRVAFEVIVVSTWKNGFVYWFFFNFLFSMQHTHQLYSCIYLCGMNDKKESFHFANRWRHFLLKSLFFLLFSYRGTLVWQNGRSERISRGRYPWSHAGFSGPQPEGNGDCLAILNNVYQDRVKYHDVACHHKKPTICECPWRKWKKNSGFKSLSVSLSLSHAIYWTSIHMK